MKICLVTGASRGLGLSLCQQLRSENYFVIGLARDKNKLQNLLEEKILNDFFVCDLANNESIDEFIHSFENKYHKLDLLVHNAGIQSSYDITTNIHYYGMLRKELAVNFLAPVKITSSLLPILFKQESKILLVSSLLQLGPKKSAPGYCASKAALANWITNLRAQLENTSISVLEAIPALIKTDMTDKAAKLGIPPDVLAKEIVSKLNQKTITLQGAKLAWYVAKIFPYFVKNKLLNSEG